MTPTRPKLILASSSRYRAQMLERLGVSFTVQVSGIDEQPRSDEAPHDLARRLALSKAEAIAVDHPDALIIGADQVALLQGRVLGKPGTRERAVAQLAEMSGCAVDFLSAIALLGPDCRLVDIVATRLQFRKLGKAEIERYVDADRPLDCAGAMRSEALGIALLDAVSSDDPSALIGLPLIRISQWLRAQGLAIP